VQNNSLMISENQPFLLPGAEYAAYGVKGRSSELSHVLASKRDFNLDALLDLPARLISEPQQGAGNPALYFFACKFNHPIVGVLKAAPHGT
jgi:hypothetical protein